MRTASLSHKALSFPVFNPISTETNNSDMPIIQMRLQEQVLQDIIISFNILLGHKPMMSLTVQH